MANADILSNPEHLLRNPDLITHREPPCTRIRLGFLNYIAHITHPLQLMIDVQNLILQINVFDCQSAELRDADAGVEQDV